jgi:protein SCO1/2
MRWNEQDVMRNVRNLVLASLVLAAVPPALAHSLQEVEEDFQQKEKYFQAVDSEAPGFTLQDSDGRAVRLSDFRGKVVVLHFIYASCPDVCPLHAEKIAEIQSLVNQTPMKDKVQFITITTDPKRDKGDILRRYGAAHGLDPVNWTFLTAPPDQADDLTRKLAESYGLKFTNTPDGLQMHGVVTHVIDQDGRLRGKFHGLKFESVNAVVYINALTNRALAPHPHGEPSLWQKLKELF